MVARRAATLVLAAALATGLAACGGGDDEDGRGDVQLEDVESDASSSGSSSDDDEDAEATEDESSSDDEATDEAIDDAIEGAFSEGCGEFAGVFGALGGAIAGSFDPEAEAEFEQFVDDAPEEIRDDLETIASAYDELNAALEDAGIDLTDPSSFDPSNSDFAQAIAAASQQLATPEFQEASLAINEFIASNCEG
jgi:hypothetical protein